LVLVICKPFQSLSDSLRLFRALLNTRLINHVYLRF